MCDNISRYCIQHIKKCLSVLYVLLICADSTCAAEEVILDLRKESNLLWIYESGLRPRYGTSDQSLEIKDKTIHLILPDGQTILLNVTWMRIDVLGDDRIDGFTMDTKGEYSIEDARKIVQSYSKILGPSQEDFESFAKETVSNQRGFMRSIFGSRKWGVISVGWNMFPNMYSKTPFRIRITVNWNRPNTDRPFNNKPLKPPPGFEQFSMEREAPHPIIPPASLEPAASIKPQGQAAATPSAPVPKVFKQPEPTKVAPQSERWPVIVTVLLCISAFLFYRFKTKNPASPK